MRRTPRTPTLWHVSDPLWQRVEAILTVIDPPGVRRARGRPKVDPRRVLDGIIFRLRTGCQWNHIPPVYGSDSTLHRYYVRWCREGTFEKIWEVITEDCPELSTLWSPPSETPVDGGAAQVPGDGTRPPDGMAG